MQWTALRPIVLVLGACTPIAPKDTTTMNTDIPDSLALPEQRNLSPEHAKAVLSAAQYNVLFEAGTEPPFSSPLNKEKRPGTYVTAGCKIPVFRSDDKFNSGTGWPSFSDAAYPENIQLREDTTHGMTRTEVVSSCGEHLGHVFPDGPDPTGLRYCLNGAALEFIPDESE